MFPRIPFRPRHWRNALLLLCLLATGAVQLAAATHWHAPEQALSADASPHAPDSDAPQHHDCLLCKVSAQAGSAAPPPAPWALVSSLEIDLASGEASQGDTLTYAPSHSWQGRAPPLN